MKEIVLQVVFFLICVGNFIIPKRRAVLINSFPDIEDQGLAILRQLEHNKYQGKIIILVDGNIDKNKKNLHRIIGDFSQNIIILKKTSPRGIWNYWRSQVVLITHGIYGFLPIPKKQCLINIWHGMPFKGIFIAIDSKVPQCDFTLSTSPTFTKIMANVTGFPSTKVAEIGLPRNDLLYSKSPALDDFDQKIRPLDGKIVFYLPTYRKASIGYNKIDGLESGDLLNINARSLIRLDNLLKENNALMFVKPHPMSIHYGQTGNIGNHIRVISDDWLQKNSVSFYELLGRADILITDASSVQIDYSLLERPIIVYFPDIENYKRSRGFLLNPIEEWMPGPICKTSDEMINELQIALETGKMAEKYKLISARLQSNKDAFSTKRLFDKIKQTKGISL